MELPHLGKHCSEPTCNNLDFLPVKCDSCSKIFCGNHMLYDRHNCESAYKKDVQVPVCPLCNEPIPIKRGELPDVRVGEHIDRDCQSDPAKKNRIYVNKCSMKHCKTKEIIKVLCPTCNLNYCLKHRHSQDHDCQSRKNESSNHAASRQANPNANAAKAAMYRAQNPPNNYMSEDEALARAIQLSLSDNRQPEVAQARSRRQNNSQHYTEDEELARAIFESEAEYQSQQQGPQKKECTVI